MRNIRSILGALLVATCIAAPWRVAAVTLAVPSYQQLMNQWCWAGSSQMILEYYGVVKTQAEIAQYGSGGSNHWNLIFGSAAASGTQPALTGIDLILKHFGAINSTRYYRALTAAELQKEMDAQHPAVARIGWTGGGGHFVVLRGFDGTTIDINDPWPANGQLIRIYTNFLAGGAGVYTAGSGGHSWTHTLTTAASIDLAFVIDSTGSMGDDIANVKASANIIVTNLIARFADARIAVVDYKDYPVSPYGSPGDYVAMTRAAFTTNKTTVLNAINSLSAGGGNDLPESVYSALFYTLDGAAIGGWRTNPTQRIIILMGDAPGHDPEPWAGGHSLGDVLAKATAEGFQITIDTLVTAGGGSEDLAVIAFQAIAGGSGGSSFFADSASAVASNITQIIDERAISERNPRGGVAAFRPKFSFNLVGDGMAGAPDYYVVDVMRQNPTTHKWGRFSRTKLPPGVTSYTPSKPLPKATYRWRLGYKQSGNPILSPDGDALAKVKPSLVFENSYTEFERLDVQPGDSTLVSPSSFFTAQDASITYTWNAALNATSYAVIINHDGKVKRVTVKPPANNPGAATLSVTVKGHKVGDFYQWQVVPLNADHPKP